MVDAEMLMHLNIGDTAVETIDGRPAVEIYKKYLGVEPNESFTFNICEFPLVVRRNDTLDARVPCNFGEDGKLYFMGDFRADDQVRLSYALPEEVLSG